MKKAFKLFLVLCVGLVLVACGGKKEEVVVYNVKAEIDSTLQKYAEDYTKRTGVKVTIKTSVTANQNQKADFQAGNEPEIVVFEGVGQFLEFKDRMTDLSSEKWVKDTDFAFKNDGKVYGFPIAVEGYGLSYNKDILDKVGIDPKTLTNYAAYEKAFALIDSKKAELGLKSVVAFGAGPELYWATGHMFNAYLSNGLAYDDKSITNNVLAGKVDDKRLAEYVDWATLIFKYSTKEILTLGTEEGLVEAFKQQQVAFNSEGNWQDAGLEGVTFKMGLSPIGSQKNKTLGIFVSSGQYWGVNNKSKNPEGAKKFLEDMAMSAEGKNFIINEAKLVSPFKNNELPVAAPLSKDVQAYIQSGNVYAWNSYSFPSGFIDNELGPIMEQYAKGSLTKAELITKLKDKIATLPSMTKK